VARPRIASATAAHARDVGRRVHADLHLQDREGRLVERARCGGRHALGGVVVDEAHQGDAGTHAAAEQPPHRRAERLAGHVPERHLERRDGERVVRQGAVHGVLEGGDVARVATDHDGREVGAHVGDDRLGRLAVRGVVDAGLAVADEAGVGVHLDEDGDGAVVAAVGGGQCGHARDRQHPYTDVGDGHACSSTRRRVRGAQRPGLR
jgi:hypothetical protein